MEVYQIVLIVLCLILPLLSILFAIAYTRKSNRAIKNSQYNVSDKELIKFVNNQPDKIVNKKTLMKKFGLSKFEATGRLRHLLHNGVLRILRSRSGLKVFYTLANPIQKPHDLVLSDDPFMTIEDLLLIFNHYDYQVTLQDICLSTGLPIKVILEEMKYFEKEKVVNCLFMTGYGSTFRQRIYKLREPYRSNPEQYISLKDANFELKEIYKNVREA